MRLGFTIVARNARVGRLELDIVAQSPRLVVICEVRARTHDRLMSPAHTIDRAKVARVRRAGALWLRENSIGRVDVRFDAAAVIFDTPGGRVEYYEGAF
jgi:putative endonuclease